MKSGLISAILVLCAITENTNAKPFAVIIPQQKSKLTKHITSICGGDLGPITSKTLANTFTCIAAIDAVCGTVAPVAVSNKCGIQINENSAGHLFAEVLGAHAAGITVTSYLAITGKFSIEESIAYGFVVRAALALRMLLVQRLTSFGASNKGLVIFLLIAAGLSYSLFTGQCEPLRSVKVVSAIMVLVGTSTCLNPAPFAKKVFGIDVDSEGIATKEMVKYVAAYVVMGGLYNGFLACGVDPIKAAGYTSLAILPHFTLLVQNLSLVTNMNSFLGIGMSTWILLAVALFTGIGAGTICE